jgi:carbon-monoxide dehydrogenase medium subunit
MTLPCFELTEPTSIGEACRMLQGNGEIRLIAGGTDLLVGMKRKGARADLVVSLSRIGELRSMWFPDQTTLVLGAMVSIDDISESPLIKANFPALSNAAGKVGSPEIRNRATIGGNICATRPAGDTIGPLIAYGATVEIAGPTGARSAAVESIFGGSGQTTLGKDEILTSIWLKRPADGTGASYAKFTVRHTLEVPLVSVTSVVSLENGVCRSATLVLGAVAPTFMRCPAAEGLLTGKEMSEAVAERAGYLAGNMCSPTSGLPGLAHYRRRLVEMLVKQSLLEAASVPKSNCGGLRTE